MIFHLHGWKYVTNFDNYSALGCVINYERAYKLQDTLQDFKSWYQVGFYRRTTQYTHTYTRFFTLIDFMIHHFFFVGASKLILVLIFLRFTLISKYECLELMWYTPFKIISVFFCFCFFVPVPKSILVTFHEVGKWEIMNAQIDGLKDPRKALLAMGCSHNKRHITPWTRFVTMKLWGPLKFIQSP